MDLLNLPHLSVTKTELKQHGYEVWAKVANRPVFCPHCGSVDGNLSKYGKKQQVFMDLPMHGQHVGIMPWTKTTCVLFRFRQYVEQHSLRRTFVSIAEELGISEGMVRNICNTYIDQLEEDRHAMTPRWLGMDEIHILGKARGVIANVEENTLIDLLTDRNKETITRYLSNLPERHNIEIVTMDMWWNPYRDAVYEALPNADIVVDKFHVVRIANQSVEFVRKQIRKELDDKKCRQLKNDRFLMLKRRKDLTPMKQLTLDSWTLNFPRLK